MTGIFVLLIYKLFKRVFVHQGADQCVACLNLMDGPHCVSTCPNGVNGEKGQTIFKYSNALGHCELCHLNCTRG